MFRILCKTRGATGTCRILQNLDCYTVTICVTLCECRGWQVKAETAADELHRVSMGGISLAGKVG